MPLPTGKTIRFDVTQADIDESKERIAELKDDRVTALNAQCLTCPVATAAQRTFRESVRVGAFVLTFIETPADPLDWGYKPRVDDNGPLNFQLGDEATSAIARFDNLFEMTPFEVVASRIGGTA